MCVCVCVCMHVQITTGCLCVLAVDLDLIILLVSIPATHISPHRITTLAHLSPNSAALLLVFFQTISHSIFSHLALIIVALSIFFASSSCIVACEGPRKRPAAAARVFVWYLLVHLCFRFPFAAYCSRIWGTTRLPRGERPGWHGSSLVPSELSSPSLG